MDKLEMRLIVENAYPGEAWAAKARKFSDQQVFAVYQRLVNSGKVNVTPRKVNPENV